MVVKEGEATETVVKEVEVRAVEAVRGGGREVEERVRAGGDMARGAAVKAVTAREWEAAGGHMVRVACWVLSREATAEVRPDLRGGDQLGDSAPGKRLRCLDRRRWYCRCSSPL